MIKFFSNLTIVMLLVSCTSCSYIKQGYDYWDNMDPDERQEIISDIVDRIEDLINYLSVKSENMGYSFSDEEMLNIASDYMRFYSKVDIHASGEIKEDQILRMIFDDYNFSKNKSLNLKKE